MAGRCFVYNCRIHWDRELAHLESFYLHSAAPFGRMRRLIPGLSGRRSNQGTSFGDRDKFRDKFRGQGRVSGQVSGTGTSFGQVSKFRGQATQVSGTGYSIPKPVCAVRSRIGEPLRRSWVGPILNVEVPNPVWRDEFGDFVACPRNTRNTCDACMVRRV
jgi:hypothetical protein